MSTRAPFQTLVAGMIAGLVGSSAIAGDQTDESVVRRDWLTGIHVTQGVRERDPIFIEGTTYSCSDTIVGAPAVLTPSGGIVVVEVPIDTAPVCTGHNLPVRHALPIGTLPQGTHSLVVVGRDENLPGTAFVLSVSMQPPGLVVDVARPQGLRANHSGMWGVPERPGEGFNVLALEGGVVFIYFGKDATGQSLLLLSEQIPHQSTTGKLYSVRGGSFDQPSGDLDEWGEMIYSFAGGDSGSDCAGLRVQLVRGGQIVKAVQMTRIAAPRSQPSCR